MYLINVDDIVFFAEYKEDLQRPIEHVYKRCKKWKMFFICKF